jgi:hypothetical protein
MKNVNISFIQTGLEASFESRLSMGDSFQDQICQIWKSFN